MKAHRTDLLSLVFGLLMLASVVWWLLGRALHLPLPQAGWIFAGVLILFGALGLAGALRSDRAHPEEPIEAVVPPDEITTDIR